MPESIFDSRSQPRPAEAGSGAMDQALFDGPGEMRALCRDFDWSTTPLGPVAGWPLSLRTVVGILLGSRNPMFLFWGPDLIQFYNDAYRPSLGAAGTAVSRHPRALGMRGREFWTDIWDAIGPQITQVMTTGIPTWHEDQYLPIERDGRLDDVWWTYSYGPVHDDNGRINGVLVVCQETTPRIRAEQERERLIAALERERAHLAAALREVERLLAVTESARAEAEAANRVKSQFLTTMSHELRTPLNAIGGYTELLQIGIEGSLGDKQLQFLDRIRQSQVHLLGLINEVLNFAKLETGAVRFEIADVNIRPVLVAAEALVSPQAQARGLQLDIGQCAPGLAVRADPEKVRQIIVNLLSNAVKFTDRGGRINVAVADSAGSVRVDVRDTGIGIPADKLDAIFDPFVQVRSDLTRPYEGTGLGLAISRDLARAQGGDLTVESEPGVGSTFSLSLPRAL
jgi:signal transduction histidine kinase